MPNENKKSKFYLKNRVVFEDLKVGDKDLPQIEESDLSFQTETTLYQFDIAEEPKRQLVKIKTGVYSLEATSSGILPTEMELREYHLLDSISNAKTIMNEGDKFFSKLDVYTELKLEPKRAVLLYSQPGVGKTSSINAVCKKYLKEEGTVVHIWDTSSVRASDVSQFYLNDSEFDSSVKRLILVIEDIGGSSSEDDHYSPRSASSSLLNLLDGIGRPFKGVPTFIIGTTNNPEKSVGALIDRPGRFDKVIEVPAPSESECKELLSFYLNREINEEEQEAAKVAAKNKFSIAHLQEAITRTKLDDISVKEAVIQLAEHKAKVKKAFANVNDRLGL
jgi:hypothetical protein